MSISLKTLNTKPVRFASIGVINTLVDLSLYALLRGNLGFFFANLVSTSVGMVVGYVLHRNYTFRATHRRTSRETILFFTCTILGLWALQPLVIYFTTGPVTKLASGLPHDVKVLAPKCLAIAVSLVWNYVCYNQVVFKKHLEEAVGDS